MISVVVREPRLISQN